MLPSNNIERVVYDNRIQRYRSLDTGRFISNNEVQQAIEDRIEYGFNRLDNYLAAALDPNNDFTLDDYKTAFSLELKYLSVTLFAIGAGGKKNVTPSMWGQLGNKLKSDYKYLNGFLKDIAEGKLTERQIRARAGMYANGVYTSYWLGNRENAKLIYTEERRVLRPAEHCKDCIDYAALGWQPIGTLPPPGIDSQCLSNCRCVMEYR